MISFSLNQKGKQLTLYSWDSTQIPLVQVLCVVDQADKTQPLAHRLPGADCVEILVSPASLQRGPSSLIVQIGDLESRYDLITPDCIFRVHFVFSVNMFWNSFKFIAQLTRKYRIPKYCLSQHVQGFPT